MAQCISRSTGKPMGLIQGDAEQQKALCINFGNTYIDDDGTAYQAQTADESFDTSTEANNNANQYAFEMEQARIKAEEEAKTTEVEQQPKETKILDNNELLNIVSDNDNNLDKVITETSGDKGVKTTYENKRDKPKEAEDTTPVANTDIYTGNTIQTGGKKKDETPSAVTSFLKGTGDLALAGAVGGGKYLLDKTSELYANADLGQSVQQGGVGGAHANTQGIQGGASEGELQDFLPNLDTIAPVGNQPGSNVDDTQFVNTMDGQLSDQGYMGPQLGPQEDLEAMSLANAPQYNIEGLPTLHQEGGQFIDNKPEDVIAGGQNIPSNTQGEFNSGFNNGSFDARNFHSPELAEFGGTVERGLADFEGAALGGIHGAMDSALKGMSDIGGAVEDAVLAIVSDTSKAVQNLEQVMAETGIINDPQAVEAVNEFVQKVDELVEAQPEDDDLDTLMMQAEFDAEMLDEDYASRAPNPLDEWTSKDKYKSAMDDITDFLGDMLTQFTEITGITSQDLMRALIMYAGSRLLGFNSYDSLNFAYGDFEKNIARRFEENKESREFKANTNNLFNEIESLEAERDTAMANGDDAKEKNLNRRIAAFQSELDTTLGGKDTAKSKNTKRFFKEKKKMGNKLASDIRELDDKKKKGLLLDEDYDKQVAALKSEHDQNLKYKAHGLGVESVNYDDKGDFETLKAGHKVDLFNRKQVGKHMDEVIKVSDMAHKSKADIDYYLNVADTVYTGPMAGVFASLSRLSAGAGFGAFDMSASYEALMVKSMDFIEQRMDKTKGSITEKEMQLFADASPKIAMTAGGMKLILQAWAYNDQYVMDHETHLNAWIEEFEADPKNKGMHPSMAQVRAEDARYKRANVFELPFTNEDIAEAEKSRRFKITPGMTRGKEYSAIWKNKGNAKTKEEMDAVAEAADFLGHLY